MNWELPDVQAGFRKGRGNRDEMANICWIIEKARGLQKNMSASLTMPKSLTVQITTNCEKSQRDGNTRPPYLPPEKPACSSWSNSQKRTWNNGLVQNWERSVSSIVTCLFNICRAHHVKCQSGWIPNWNQCCWEKCQQPQICRWYSPNGRKRRGIKEHLDDGERGQWKKN